MVLVIAFCYNSLNYEGNIIMEFEDNTPVSDVDRRLAEAKKLTLQPMHSDIAPDDMPDSVIASRHVNEPAIANIASDTEESTASAIQPSKGLLAAKSATKPAHKHVASIVISSMLFIGLAAFAFLK